MDFSAEIPECGYQVEQYDKITGSRSILHSVPYLTPKF